MKKTEFDAYLNEFPFLADVLADSHFSGLRVSACDGVRIARLGQEALEFVPHEDEESGNLVGICIRERISFVLDDGTVILNAVKQDFTYRSHSGHGSDRSGKGETILNAIDRLNIAESVRFVVRIDSGYEVQDSESQANWKMTVYKLAKDFTIASMLQTEREVFTALATAAVKEIDAPYTITCHYVEHQENGLVFPTIEFRYSEATDRISLRYLPAEAQARIEAIVERFELKHLGGGVVGGGPNVQHWQTNNIHEFATADFDSATAREIVKILLDACEQPMEWHYGSSWGGAYVPYPGTIEDRSSTFRAIAQTYFAVRGLDDYFQFH